MLLAGFLGVCATDDFGTWFLIREKPQVSVWGRWVPYSMACCA